jgi:hypothetical protein
VEDFSGMEGIKKVSLQEPEDFSGMGERRKSNSNDIMLSHHDARTPAKRANSSEAPTAETLATAWKRTKALTPVTCNSRANNRRNTCNSIGASNIMVKGKSMDASNSRANNGRST